MTYSHHPLDNKLLLGRYRVIRLLGEGGMGTVHLARVEGAEGFMRPVVVKRMKRDIRATEEGNRLFVREAKILSKLQHPSIVGISDFGVEDGAHLMVLDYVHGYTLSPWLEYRQRRNLPLPVDVCLFIVRRILDALHYAHHFDTEEGQEIEIVHRDISPDNVLLSNKGYVHLLDFGVASMRGPEGEGATLSGAFRGKLCYAAPETVKGEPATPRSDQYSAAVVLLELLTGTTPFTADSIGETFLKMVNEIPDPPSKVRPDLPPGLDDVIARALAKEPLDRFDSALAFSRELRRLQQNDDEEVAEELRELVRNEFELLPAEVGIESLKTRELALAKTLSVAPGAVESSPGELWKPAHEVATIAQWDISHSHPDTPTAVAAPAPPAPEQKQLHGLLWGLLVVGGLIALGLGAAVAVLSRSHGGGEQVVVVGGERFDSETRSQRDSTPPSTAPLAAAPPASVAIHVAPVETASSPSDAEEGAPVLTNSESQSGADATERTVTAPVSKKERGKKLSGAVQQKSSAFQACFAKHLEQAEDSPRAVLHFSVAKQGGGAQVTVEPSALAATPLGRCLQGAATQVQFPKLEESVAFRVPVRARVVRAKGK